MIAPTFEPETTPGAGMAAFDTGMNQAQSWMQRSNAMQLQKQQEQLQQQEIDRNAILQPVMAAKADADVATAHATLSSVQRQQQLRAQAALVSPQAEQELIAATQIPDFTQQEAALGTLQAKYAWMDNVPEMKPLVDTINNARAKATTMVLANKHIDAAQKIADTRADTNEQQIEQRAQAAELNARTRVELQAKDMEHKREVDDLNRQLAELKAKTAVTVGGGHDTARTGSTEITSGGRLQSSAGRVFAEEADTLEKAAQNETDVEAKSLLQKKAQAYRTKSEQALKATPPATDSATTAPTRVDKNAATISIGGKVYPVFKDAKGNRAYQVDGHFVPLTPE